MGRVPGGTVQSVLKVTFSCLLMVEKLYSEAQKNYIPGSDRNVNKKAVSRKGTNSQQNKPSARDAELSCLVNLAPSFLAQWMLHRYSLSRLMIKKPRGFPYSLMTGSFHLNCGLWPFGNCLFRFSTMMLFTMKITRLPPKSQESFQKRGWKDFKSQRSWMPMREQCLLGTTQQQRHSRIHSS